MNLEELYNELKVISEITHKKDNLKEISVLVTTCESSIGGRAFSEVKYAHLGFDWEYNQFRIETVDRLLKEPIRDTATIKKLSLSGINFWGCSHCGLKVFKDDRFCRNCGRKLC